MRTSSKKVAIIGCVGVPAQYGGFETLTEFLVRNARSGFELHVYCSGKKYKERPDRYREAHLHYVSLDANGVSSIPYDIMSMLHAIRYADELLILGVSGCLFLPIIRTVSKARVIVNVDGIEWRRSKWGVFAKWFLRLSEGYAVRWAHQVIADNEEIQKYIEESYHADAALIAYGGDHARPVAYDNTLAEAYPFLGDSYAIKVCRIEPENNVHMVLRAFADLGSMPLVVIGNWQSSDYGRSLYERYGTKPGFFLLDPIYDQHRLDQLRSNAAIYVHGHSAGGTNPSLVEAMSLGLAVIAFDVGYNRVTTGSGAIYFASSGELVTRLAALDDQAIAEVAERMKEAADRHYTWSEISSSYFDLLSTET